MLFFYGKTWGISSWRMLILFHIARIKVNVKKNCIFNESTDGFTLLGQNDPMTALWIRKKKKYEPSLALRYTVLATIFSNSINSSLIEFERPDQGERALFKATRKCGQFNDVFYSVAVNISRLFGLLIGG